MRGRAAALAMAVLIAAGAAAAQQTDVEQERPGWNLPAYSDARGNSLTPSVSLQAAFFPQSQSWFGASKADLGSRSTYWFEEVVGLDLEGTLGLGGFGIAYGKLGGVSKHTQMTDAGVVAAASTPHDGATNYTGGNDTWYYGMMFVSVSF